MVGEKELLEGESGDGEPISKEEEELLLEGVSGLEMGDRKMEGVESGKSVVEGVKSVVESAVGDKSVVVPVSASVSSVSK